MRVRALLLPLVAAAAFLAGCATSAPGATPTTPAPTDNGVAALPADQILAKATAALKAAGSFRMKGSSAEQSGVSVDITFKGDDSKGTLGIAGQTIEFVHIGKDLYFKASDDFYKTLIPKGQEAALALLTGKFVKVNASDPKFSGFVPTVDDLLKPTGTPTKGDATTLDGKPVIALKDGDTSTMYVSTQGEPYPIKMTEKDGTDVTITEIGSAVTIAAPDAAQVFDLSALIGTGS